MRVSRYVATYQANARDETLQARKPRWRWEAWSSEDADFLHIFTVFPRMRNIVSQSLPYS